MGKKKLNFIVLLISAVIFYFLFSSIVVMIIINIAPFLWDSGVISVFGRFAGLIYEGVIYIVSIFIFTFLFCKVFFGYFKKRFKIESKDINNIIKSFFIILFMILIFNFYTSGESFFEYQSLKNKELMADSAYHFLKIVFILFFSGFLFQKFTKKYFTSDEID